MKKKYNIKFYVIRLIVFTPTKLPKFSLRRVKRSTICSGCQSTLTFAPRNKSLKKFSFLIRKNLSSCINQTPHKKPNIRLVCCHRTIILWHLTMNLIPPPELPLKCPREESRNNNNKLKRRDLTKLNDRSKPKIRNRNWSIIGRGKILRYKYRESGRLLRSCFWTCSCL